MHSFIRNAGVAVAAALSMVAVAPQANAAPVLVASPGTEVVIEHQDGSKPAACTLGPAISIPAVDRTAYGFLTAGHCGKEGDTVKMKINGKRYPLNKLVGSVDTDTNGVHHDYALVILPKESINPVIGGSRAPKGFLYADEVQPGMTACSYGITSGERCGKVISSDSRTGVIRTSFPSLPGDSGGPVYVVEDGVVAYIGTLRGSRDSGDRSSAAVAIDFPLAAYNGLKVVTAA